MGGLTTSKRIEPNAVGGYLQALRGKNTLEIKKSIEESRNAVGRSHVVIVDSEKMKLLIGVTGLGSGGISRGALWRIIPGGVVEMKLRRSINPEKVQREEKIEEA